MAITVGTFDGVHRGHARLVQAAREGAMARARAGAGAARVVALVFDPSPASVLRPHDAPARLSHFDQRRAWLLEAGADRVERLVPDRDLLAMSPEGFARFVCERHRPALWVEGPDFRFGHRRLGDVRTLGVLGAQLGFEALIVDDAGVALSDHQVVPARSTMARWLLAQGRVFDAAVVLGRWHALTGTVVQGDRRGRTIGFPTANLVTDLLAPMDGVYGARATVAHAGRVATLAAAVNIGARPTVDAQRTIEAHVICAQWPPAGDDGAGALAGLPEYGWELQLELVAYLREQARFAGLDALRAQLARDVARAREVVEHYAPCAQRAPVASGSTT